MARPLSLLALLSVTSLPTLLAAQAFEGTLRMRNLTIDATPLLGRYDNDPDKLIAAPWERILAAARDAGAQIEEDSLIYQIKGSRLRMSAGALTASSYTITDVKTGAVLLVDPEQRTYMAWGREDVQKMMEGVRATGPEPQEPAPPAFEPLGTTRDLRGRRCAEYRMTDEQAITIACLTRDLAGLATLFQQLGELALEAGDERGKNELAELTRHGFPVLVRELTIEGDDETRSAFYEIQELVTIERGTLSESLFTPPPGFRKTTLPGSP